MDGKSARAVEWRERLGRFKGSGLTVAKFCAKERVSVPSFYQWRRKLNARGRKSTRADRFQRVAVSMPSVVTVRFGNGARMELPAGDGEAIRTVVDALVYLGDPAEGGNRC